MLSLFLFFCEIHENKRQQLKTYVIMYNMHNLHNMCGNQEFAEYAKYISIDDIAYADKKIDGICKI
jgi:hypothetical protein